MPLSFFIALVLSFARARAPPPLPPGHVLHHRKLDVEPDRVAADAAGVAEKLALHGHPHAAAALRLAQAALQTVRPSTGCSGTIVSWLCCIGHISCS